MNGFIGTERVVSDVVDRENGSIWYRMKGVDDFYFVSDVMKRVDDKKVACILTEKVLVGDVPCRKILGFEGILGREDLPKKYIEGQPAFWLVPAKEAFLNQRIFDGTEVILGETVKTDGIDFRLPENADPRPDMGGFSDVLSIGDVVKDSAFQNIIMWLKRAGSRLVKIRQQERDAWRGKETIEI